MIDPIELEFTVACSPEQAFDLWTRRTSVWWPASHSLSGSPGLVVTFEPQVGGRVYERTPDGTEHDWGEVVVWEPPTRLGYLWHLAFDRSDATDVVISFLPDPAGTRVLIRHTGWERLGSVGEDRRDRNLAGWSGLLPHFRAAVSG